MKRLYFGVLFVLFLNITGCLKNPFDTRNSQPPAGATGTWETPASPEVMVSNLIYAYNERNIQNYQACFDSGFVFSALEDSIEAEAQGNGHLYYFWTKGVEVSTTENIFSPALSAGKKLIDISMTSSENYLDNVEDTLAVLYREYNLRVYQTDSLSQDTVLIEGLAAFSLVQTAFNLWTIYLWEEIPFGRSDYDWGNFKAEYRNQ